MGNVTEAPGQAADLALARAFGPDGGGASVNDTSANVTLTFPTLDFDTADLPGLEVHIRKELGRLNVSYSATVPIRFAKGSVVATVAVRNAADKAMVAANAAAVVKAAVAAVIANEGWQQPRPASAKWRTAFPPAARAGGKCSDHFTCSTMRTRHHCCNGNTAASSVTDTSTPAGEPASSCSGP